jgi:hypothetical protein
MPAAPGIADPAIPEVAASGSAATSVESLLQQFLQGAGEPQKQKFDPLPAEPKQRADEPTQLPIAHWDFKKDHAIATLNGIELCTRKLVKLDPSKGSASRVGAYFNDVLYKVQGIWWEITEAGPPSLSAAPVVRPIKGQKDSGAA